MSMTPSPLPVEIRKARLAAGLSMRASAELIGYTRRQWCNWEYGITPMRPRTWAMWNWSLARAVRIQRQRARHPRASA